MPPLDPATLRREQMRAAIDGYLPVAALTAATSLLIYGFFSDAPGTNRFAANLWLAWQAGLCLSWVLLSLRYRRDFSPIEAVWERRIELPLTVLSGLGWGLSWPVFMDPGNLASVILLNVITSAAFFVYAVSTPLHGLITNVGLLACGLPVIAYAFVVDTPLFRWIGVGAVILVLGALLFARVVHRIYLGAVEQAHENRRLVAELKQEQARVERANRDKQQFFSAASHDLRQPIQALKLFQGVLAAELTGPRQRALLHKMGEAIDGLSRLLTPLTDIARLDSGRLRPEPRWIGLDDLLRRIEQRYGELAAEQDIALRRAVTARQAFVDPRHLERVLSNLVVNAIAHMGRPGAILLGVRRGDGRRDGGAGQPAGRRRLRIEVLDNGQGIPAEHQARVFDELYQVGNPERNRARGVGLGLAIVRRLCALMSCRITLESSAGRGCRFTLHLEQPAADKAPAAEPPVSVPAARQLPTIAGIEVLILEDDGQLADALHLQLAAWGFRPRTAYDTASARAALEGFAPRLVLADLELRGGETAPAVIKALERHLGRRLPALLITGRVEGDPPALPGVPPVLHKPIAPGRLRAGLLALLPKLDLDQ
ncbi:ATP-binding protein [uncultured Thiohalocapsa sp.]|uniref:ATP-binding protein n=1 Tax=uncultured Thiohalocapsa sp. TaxID=768990 RepID=UPI0025D8E164|nr:ATP-binding protein [uncultured Thiohalocapsa sp.]